MNTKSKPNTKIEVKLTGDVELPPEIKALYSNLYKKINNLILTQNPIDIRNDPTTMRILIQSSMVIVEGLKGTNGIVYSGPEKKKYAIILTKLVLRDLANSNKIDKVSAQETINNMDFYGGVTMDLAIDGVAHLFNFIQDQVQQNQNMQNIQQQNQNMQNIQPQQNMNRGCFSCFGK